MDGLPRNTQWQPTDTCRLYVAASARPKCQQPLDIFPERVELGNHQLQYEEVQENHERPRLGIFLRHLP